MGTETPPPPKKLLLSLGSPGPHLIHGSLHPDESTAQKASLFSTAHGCDGWLGSRVVSVLDSGAEVQIAVATLSVNIRRQTAHTHCASVHQAAKLVAALLRAAGVTAGLAESNGSLPPGL